MVINTWLPCDTTSPGTSFKVENWQMIPVGKIKKSDFLKIILNFAKCNLGKTELEAMLVSSFPSTQPRAPPELHFNSLACWPISKVIYLLNPPLPPAFDKYSIDYLTCRWCWPLGGLPWIPPSSCLIGLLTPPTFKVPSPKLIYMYCQWVYFMAFVILASPGSVIQGTSRCYYETN